MAWAWDNRDGLTRGMGHGRSRQNAEALCKIVRTKLLAPVLCGIARIARTGGYEAIVDLGLSSPIRRHDGADAAPILKGAPKCNGAEPSG
jgi:hypothetical protein